MPILSDKVGGFYADLVKGLSKLYDITVIAPCADDKFVGLRSEGTIRVLRIPSKPIQGNISLIKKGIRLIKLNERYIRAYKKYLGSEKFDYVFMPTPPMNFVDVAEYIKERSGAKLYLILRDIHPECLDRRKISEKVKGDKIIVDESREKYYVNPIIYSYLYKKAQRLYRISDLIACMSPGNMEYMKSISSHVDDKKLCILPNWYNGNETSKNFDSEKVKLKYGLDGKYIAIFGGTIGPAQAVWNIAVLAKANLEKSDILFLIVGRGSRKETLKKMADELKLTNIKFIDYLPKEDYEQILKIADVGLISIDEKYTVPTCPSKVIGYMALGKPVIAMMNKDNDYGDYYIARSGCGLYSQDANYEKFISDFNFLYEHEAERRQMGLRGYDFYKNYLTVSKICDLIKDQLNHNR